MAAALRKVSVERGHDPRGAALVAFGGAGGLHACALAEALGCGAVLFPRHAGVLSALGALDRRIAPRARAARFCSMPARTATSSSVARRARGRGARASSRRTARRPVVERWAEVRYRGPIARAVDAGGPRLVASASIASTRAATGSPIAAAGSRS